jgi:diketogulonate reductase-like aldo/keto reductase
VVAALHAGYRHIDTAWKYGTERAVGEATGPSGTAAPSQIEHM